MPKIKSDAIKSDATGSFYTAVDGQIYCSKECIIKDGNVLPTEYLKSLPIVGFNRRRKRRCTYEACGRKIN